VIVVEQASFGAAVLAAFDVEPSTVGYSPLMRS
jgi:hypothetical protein